MYFLFEKEVYPARKIFRASSGDSDEDGLVIAENCLLLLDDYNVLSIFDADRGIENTWDDVLHVFPLNNATSIVFKKIQSTSGRHVMGRVVIKGLFRLTVEKVTIKMDLHHYNELIEAINQRP